MADEPRRSGRATKGQHKNASSSPAPVPQPKPAAKATAGKKSKKTASQPVSEDEGEDEEDRIRCICGNENPKDKRAFIGCDACSVWQHNVCMGMPDDEDEVGEHYFCEQCRPEEHMETLEAIGKGEKIWETRNKIWQQEKKMSKNRKAKTSKGGWLKKEVKVEAAPEPPSEPKEVKETGNKRKRESEVPQPEPQAEAPTVEPAVEPAADKPLRVANQGKRRKSSAPEKKAVADPETAIVSIEELPIERKKIAQALSKLIEDGVNEMVEKGWPVPQGQTPQSIGLSHASKIEYALQMNHVGPANKEYATQFRMLNANIRQNKSLLDELLSGAVTADQLATMSSSEMASDKLQQERAAMKAEADRQATIDQKESGPRYRRTHKGDELVEDEDAMTSSAPVSRPVRHSIADSEMGGMESGSPGGENTAGSPGQQMPAPETVRRPSMGGHERRTSSQQNFDVNNIWAKTAQSPTQTTTRPMQMPPRRRSSVQHQQQPDGAKEDADVDRMLADDNDDDTYAPTDSGDAIVWRGKIVQSSGDGEPTVNARFVAGRDVSSTIPWKDLLPTKLAIDGRLQVPKAEEYLCGLQWSSSSDVSVLSLTPYDDAAAFNQVFEYFQTRQRYAVVNKDKPPMIKDLYIIPIEPGAKLPDHVDMLEHCTVKQPVEERLLLATFVVARPPAPNAPEPIPQHQQPQQHIQHSNGHHFPPHLTQGPQGSPLQATGPQFSPAPQTTPQPYMPSPIPPNPYSNSTPTHHAPTPPYPQQPPPPYTPFAQPQPFLPHQHQPQMQQQQPQMQQPQQYVDHPLAAQILGDLFTCSTAQDVLRSDPNVTEDKIRNLELILRENEACRTDIQALGMKLMAGSGGGGGM